MSLGPDDIALIARLARLRLEDGEIAELTPRLARVLEFMARLDEVDVSSAEATNHVGSASCPLREDHQAPCLSQDEATSDAPEVRDGMFAVPRILG